MATLNSLYSLVANGTVVTSVAGLADDVTAVQLTTVLNALTGVDRLDYNSLQNAPTTFSSTWGDITGTLSAQTDLQSALNSKYDNPVGTVNDYIRG